jgi:hypothetical protein
MVPLDGPTVGSLGMASLPATLQPLLFDPDTGRLFWLDTDRRLVTSPVGADGRTSLGTAAPIPLPVDDARVDVVATLLRDIADVTGRPLPVPVSTPPVDGYDEYTVVWFNHDYEATSPRQAAEHSWLWMRCSDSQACVFHVVNRRTGARVEVDLLDDDLDMGADAESPA